MFLHSELSYPEYAVGLSAVVLYGFKVCLILLREFVARSVVPRPTIFGDFRRPILLHALLRKTAGKNFG